MNTPKPTSPEALRELILKDGTARAYGSVADVKKQYKSKSIEDIFVSIYNEKSSEVAHG